MSKRRYLLARLVCTWTAATVLCWMVAGVAYYLVDSGVLELFDGMSALGEGEVRRRVEGTVGKSGMERTGVYIVNKGDQKV